MTKRILLAFEFVLILLFLNTAAQGNGAVAVSKYAPENLPELPEVLNVGYKIDAGELTFRLLNAPILSKSSNLMVADKDTKYLLIHVEITNNSGKKVGWLAPESFVIRDTYLGRIYGTYKLDIVVSAKASMGSAQQVFYSGIEPGKSIYTTLAFMVYPDVESWIFTFAPQTWYGGSLGEAVDFQLPAPILN